MNFYYQTPSSTSWWPSFSFFSTSYSSSSSSSNILTDLYTSSGNIIQNFTTTWEHISTAILGTIDQLHLTRETKRTLFTLSLMIFCYILLLNAVRLCRWLLFGKRSSSSSTKFEDEQQQQYYDNDDSIVEQEYSRSFIARLPMFEWIEKFSVHFCGATLGIILYHVHQHNNLTTKLMLDWYKRLITSIVYHATGFEFTTGTASSSSSLNENQFLLLGTVLAALILYTIYQTAHFTLIQHPIFGFILSLIGVGAYLYEFTVSSATAAQYSGNMFIIDHDRMVARIVPQLIPKILLIFVILYHLLLVCLKSFTLFLRLLLRVTFFLLLIIFLSNSIASVMKDIDTSGGSARSMNNIIINDKAAAASLNIGGDAEEQLWNQMHQ